MMAERKVSLRRQPEARPIHLKSDNGLLEEWIERLIAEAGGSCVLHSCER